MKIVIACDVLGEENNGTTIAAMNLIRFLKKRGHEVRVICPDDERRGEEGFFVVPQLNVGPLNAYIRKVGVSIAVSDNYVLEQAIRGADAVHIMTPFFLGKAALDYARDEDIPVTAGFHCQAENITSHLHLMNSQLINNLTYKAMYQLVYQYVDAIHYPTQFIRDIFEKEVGKTNGYVISNGVNSRFRKMKTERPEAWKDKFVILFTGRYGYEKSHKVLIDAVKESVHEKEIQLVFAGEGPLHDELAAYAKKLTNQPVMEFFSRVEMLHDFTGGLERALFARKTSPRSYAAAIRIKDVVQFSKKVRPASFCWYCFSFFVLSAGTGMILICASSDFRSSKNKGSIQ